MSVDTSLQLALAGEHAAIYGYGVVGARLASAEQTRARNGLNAHRSARDQIERLILAAGSAPVASEASYVVAVDGATQRQLRTILTSIEDRLCDLYAALTLERDESARAFGIAQMQATAVRATQWRGSAEAFPGLQSVPDAATSN